MGLFATMTRLFKRSSAGAPKQVMVHDDQNNDFQVAPVGKSLTSSSFTNMAYTSTDSTIIDEITTSTVDISIEEACPCGGSCTCKEEPEQEVVGSSTHDFHSGAPPTIQAILPGLDDISAPIKQESTPIVHKIEDASIIPPSSPEKLKQLTLPGFEDDTNTPPKDKKKSNTKKASAKLTRKSTVKRKKK